MSCLCKQGSKSGKIPRETRKVMSSKNLSILYSSMTTTGHEGKTDNDVIARSVNPQVYSREDYPKPRTCWDYPLHKAVCIGVLWQCDNNTYVYILTMALSTA